MAEVTNRDESGLRKALDDIRTLAGEMAQRSSFRVTFEDFHIMAAEEIRDWQEIVREESGDDGYTLPPELVDIYRLTGGFDFRWTCDADAGFIEGAVVLASLPELFQRDDEQDKPMSQCMRSWRRFDDISSDQYAAIRLGDVTTGLKCVYFMNGRSVPLNLSPRDYVSAAAEHLGILGWQVSDTKKQEKTVRELAAWK
jgi:hypothetical protein